MGEAAEMLGAPRARFIDGAIGIAPTAGCSQGFALTSAFPYTDPITRCSILAKEPIMARLTISLSDEEMRRLETLGKREGLTVEQMVRLGIHDFIGQPDDAFHAAAKRVMEKNAELYRRLS